MRYRVTACILLLQVITVACAQGGRTEEENAAQTQLETVVERLSKEGVSTVEIMHIPPYIDTKSRVTPQILEKGFQYKLTIRDMEGGVYQEEFVKALKSTTVNTQFTQVRPQSQMGDMRWGIIFYDITERRVGAIYVDGRGKAGAVGDIPVVFKKDRLFRWLNRSFSRCFR